MCTLVVAHRVWRDAPLVVAANRDEALDRPSEPPARRALSSRQVLAPRDLRGGGTWIGLNDAAVFAAVTNRRTSRLDARRRSRGELVLRALEAGDARAAAEVLEPEDAASYNPFHLVVADRGHAELLVGEADRLQRIPLDPGVHVVTERRALGDEPRAPVLERRLRSDDGSEPPSVDRLAGLLAHHAGDARTGGGRERRSEGTGASRDAEDDESICIHWSAAAYGTRSSTIVRLGAEADDVSWYHADGPPCRTRFVDLGAHAVALTHRRARGG